MSNLQAGTKGLSENMQAAQNNILLRGFFKKKKKADEKKAAELIKQMERKAKDSIKIATARAKKEALKKPVKNETDSLL